MTTMVPTRRTPRMSGTRVAAETFRHGLSIDGPIVRDNGAGDIVEFRFARRRAFVLKSPEYVDHVLHEGVDRYHKSVEYELLRSVLGLNLFTDEDESWRRHRMMLNPVLAKRHVRGLFDLMVEPVETFLDEFDQDAERIDVEMVHAMTRLTLDVVGAALFGRELGDLAKRMQSTVTAGLRAAERATRLILIANPPWWLARGSAKFIQHAPPLPPPLNKVQHVMRTVDETVWDVIHERQANPSDSEDLLGLLLSASDDQGKLPLRRVRDEATTFMLAGHETTANALAWTWYLLALNPDARDRMLAEVDTVLGDRRPTVDDVYNMPWTTACFQEAMRMFPPAWIIPRKAVADDVIDGHRIRKGSTVIMPVHSIHHDERYWPDPEVFDPTRFLPENAKKHHRSAYLPFGGGRRVCIGSSFALLEGALIISMMSQRFTYELVPGHPVEPEATLTLRPRYGMKMVAHRRHRDAAEVAA